MKKLAYILPLLFVFMPLFAQAALTITYQGNQSVGLGTYTSPMFNAVPIGTAYANRRVLFLFIWPYAFNASGVSITGLTINGTSAGSNQIVLNGGATWIGSYIWAWANIPTGTTATVDATGCTSSCNGFGSTIVYAYTFDYTLAAASPTHAEASSTATVTSLANSINTTANGFLISAIHTWSLNTITGLATTSQTDLLTANNIDSTNRRGIASESGSSANASNGVTWGWTNAEEAYATMLFWGPAATPSTADIILTLLSGTVKLLSGKLIIL